MSTDRPTWADINAAQSNPNVCCYCARSMIGIWETTFVDETAGLYACDRCVPLLHTLGYRFKVYRGTSSTTTARTTRPRRTNRIRGRHILLIALITIAALAVVLVPVIVHIITGA